jgi:hypothetical protein
MQLLPEKAIGRLSLFFFHFGDYSGAQETLSC